jgi:hypothetical protein
LQYFNQLKLISPKRVKGCDGLLSIMTRKKNNNKGIDIKEPKQKRWIEKGT